jgi:beta-glucosidase
LHQDHLQAALYTAKECIVLLQNNGILPLNGTERIAIVGPFATNKKTNGPWSWRSYNDDNISLPEAITAAGHEVAFAKAGNLKEDYTTEDYELIADCDVVLLCLGEDAHQSGEARSLTDITLPKGQNELFNRIKSLNKPCVVLLQNGRPLVLEDVLEADSILETWFLGSQAAIAICDSLYGKNNPSGKLPMTFPINTGQIPIFHDQLSTGRPVQDEDHPGEYESKYLDSKNTPRFKFAHGLSYSKFTCSNLQLDKDVIKPGESLKITVSLNNHGPYAGKQTVQVYLRDPVARISRPVRELVRTQKVFLENGESKVLSFEIGLSDLSYYLADGKLVYDKGKFILEVGCNLDSLEKREFYLE